ncbi:MAG: His/Gly/Thr/Pro-type tRNA ligase C-terminal domain-containing protein, partial [Thermoanaerobaculia bacterium]
CVYLDEKGERQPMIMGCYGLGVGRTVAAAIEQSHDDQGIIWPVPIAPFEAVVMTMGPDAAVQEAANEIYEGLKAAGVDVIFDDRDERAGVKFNDSDLIGFPVRVVIGGKNLANGNVEWSLRKDKVKQLTPRGEIVARIAELLKDARK